MATEASADALAQADLVKWIEKFDEYTDSFYYEHCETGETLWEQPTLEQLKKMKSV